jgi:hypothetical protein
MAPTLRRHSIAAARRFGALPGLVSLVLLTLPSCNRAAYQFRPSAAYLATERPTPSVPVPASLAATADSLLPAASPPSAMPPRQVERKLRPIKKPLGQSKIPRWARPLAAKIVTKRLAKMASAPPTARQHSAAFSTIIVGLSLIGVGLIGLLVGASVSASLVGAIFGVYLILLGSIAIVVGLVLLFIGLLANE